MVEVFKPSVDYLSAAELQSGVCVVCGEQLNTVSVFEWTAVTINSNTPVVVHHDCFNVLKVRDRLAQ